MALKIIAEAILRVEHKIDAVMRFLKVPSEPMHFVGLTCPSCNMPVDYTVDIQAGVVVRRCNCKTGKVPATIPLLPVTTMPGEPNARGQEPVRESAGEDQPQRGSVRKAR
jgi:hypothetical protein